jgi:hypothetical protein
MVKKVTEHVAILRKYGPHVLDRIQALTFHKAKRSLLKRKKKKYKDKYFIPQEFYKRCP